ncbi:MAG: hypothetical protein HYY85_08320 [Deltaproteobacteria bacterium]|nr:hypothetical protein [Deltaproteobacteria bacterium]
MDNDSASLSKWPFWRSAYANGDPLPRLAPAEPRPPVRFDWGEPLPDEYAQLLLRMISHEGERAGNRSFLGFMSTCLQVAETLAPTPEARALKGEYLAEELKHAILFHRLAVGIAIEYGVKDIPYQHYTFHLPRESWADDAFFHFFVDLNGAFHSRDWRESSYVPLAKIAPTSSAAGSNGTRRPWTCSGGRTPPTSPSSFAGGSRQ